VSDSINETFEVKARKLYKPLFKFSIDKITSWIRIFNHVPNCLCFWCQWFSQHYKFWNCFFGFKFKYSFINLSRYLGQETAKVPYRSSSQAATCYYQSNHSKVEESR